MTMEAQAVYRVIRVITLGTVWRSEVIHTNKEDAEEEASEHREVGETLSSVRVQQGAVEWYEH